MQQILCIIAAQRAGTTALQSLLGATGRFTNFREIFHTEVSEQPGAFFKFAEQKNLRLADLRTDASVNKMCDQYIAHLKELSGGKHILIDVKFNSWGVVRPAWHYVHEEPFFFSYLNRNKCNFVFVWRQNIAEQVLSEQIARASEKWHNLSSTEAPAEPISVNLQLLRKQTRLICLSEQFFYSILHSNPRARIYKYEWLYEDSQLNATARNELCDLVGEQLAFPPEPPIRKNTVSKDRAIVNYDEAVQVVNDVLRMHKRPFPA